jgi:hypothetical protein
MKQPQIVLEAAVKPAVAFQFLADPVNEQTWNPGALQVRLLSPPPQGVGSRFEVEGRMMGRQAMVQLVITDLRPPSFVASRATLGSLRFDTSYSVEGSEKGARVTMTVAMSAAGPLRAALPLLRAGFARRLAGLAPRLRESIEAHRSAIGL